MDLQQPQLKVRRVRPNRSKQPERRRSWLHQAGTGGGRLSEGGPLSGVSMSCCLSPPGLAGLAKGSCWSTGPSSSSAGSLSPAGVSWAGLGSKVLGALGPSLVLALPSEPNSAPAQESAAYKVAACDGEMPEFPIWTQNRETVLTEAGVLEFCSSLFVAGYGNPSAFPSHSDHAFQTLVLRPPACPELRTPYYNDNLWDVFSK